MKNFSMRGIAGILRFPGENIPRSPLIYLSTHEENHFSPEIKRVFYPVDLIRVIVLRWQYTR